MQVIDNFFPDEMFEKLQKHLLGPAMPWYYIPNISTPSWMTVNDPLAVETDALQTMMFDIERKWVSDEFKFFKDEFLYLVHTLGMTPDNMYRVRAVMTYPKPGVTAETYNIPHIDSPKSHKSMVFYVNDADGPTRLFHQKQTPLHLEPPHKDAPMEELKKWASNFRTEGFTVEHEVIPKANRLLVFDGLQYHTAGHPVNSERRVILNINTI